MLTRADLDRHLHRSLAWVSLALLVAAIAQGVDVGAGLPRPAVVAVLVAAGGALLWTWLDVRARRVDGGGMRALAVVALGTGLVQLVGGWPTQPPGRLAPALIVVSIGVAVAGFSGGWPTGVVAALLGGALYWQQRTADLGLLPAAALAGTVVVAGLTPALGASGARRVAATVEAELATLWRSREALLRVQRRAEEQARWDGLVHDKVLGALTLAARAESPVERAAAAALAGEALAFGDAAASTAADDLRAALEAAADRHGLALEVAVRTDGQALPRPVREAVLLAVDQCFANVARHAGTRQARVEGSVRHQGVDLSIIDHGCGFDPGAARVGRLGLDQAISRLASVGGAATVTSAPGAGTSVRLQVGVPEPLLEIPAVHWRLGGLRPLLGLGVAAMVLHVLLGLASYRSVHSPVMVAFVGVLMIGLTVLLVDLPDRPRAPFAGYTAGLAGAVALAATNVVTPGEVDGAYWFIGACDVPLVVLTVRRGLRWGAPSAILFAGATTVGLSSRGVELTPVLLETMPQWVAWMAAAFGVRLALERTTRALADAGAERGRLDIERAAAEEVDLVAARRRQQVLAVAGSLLTTIATATPLAASERTAATLVEAGLRDGLTAPQLSAGSMTDAVAAARRRGVTVVLAAAPGPITEEVHAVLGLCTRRLLSVASSGARVTTLYRPDAGGRVGSVTLVGPRVGTPPLVRSAGYVVESSPDEDSVLVEIRVAPGYGESG